VVAARPLLLFGVGVGRVEMGCGGEVNALAFYIFKMVRGIVMVIDDRVSG
jgi:hypothetical protein